MASQSKEKKREKPKNKSLNKQYKENSKSTSAQVSGSTAANVAVADIPLPPGRRGNGMDQTRYHTLGSAQSSGGRAFSVEYPAYLVIEAVNKEANLNEISMVKRSRELKTVCGEPKRVSRATKKAMQIDCIDGIQSKKLLAMKTFAGNQVTVTPHRSLNESKGVVSHFELVTCTDEEIKEEAAPFGVTYAKRLFKKVDGTFVPSSSVVLTFNTPHPPTSIKIGWVNLLVRPYKELPRRCRKCQSYGHGKNNCKHKQVCPRCSGLHNNDDFTYTNQPLCNNCGGPHGAYAPSCPRYKYEAEVLSVRSTQKLSFPDARAQVETSGMFPGVSYAHRTKTGNEQGATGNSQTASLSGMTKENQNPGEYNSSKRPRESDDDGSPNHITSRPSAKYRNSTMGATTVTNTNLISHKNQHCSRQYRSDLYGKRAR